MRCVLRRAGLGPALMLAACTAAPVAALPLDELTARVPILGIRGATRADVLLRLGPPSACFEGERVLTWRVREIERELRPVAACVRPEAGAGRSWQTVDYSLVVAFDAQGRIERCAAIAVR